MGQALIRVSHKNKGSIILIILPLYRKSNYYMAESNITTKRIAKNTMLLYGRMLFLMLISLYTSRVILNALGVEDYGIYNVVGGVVTMFSVLSGSLNAAIQRFITFELGTGNLNQLKKVFSSSVTIQIGIALLMIVIAETVGLWFVNYKMAIPEDRLIAANWCFQLSIITFAINLISVPYNAAIIAHEKMSAFAYISIIEAVGKLIVAWCITINPIDRLIFYAVMIALLAWGIRFLYTAYCKRNFEECTYRFIYDHNLLKNMLGFAGWNFFGAGSWQLMNQGVNLLINVFFGVTVNAARGIAVQVDNAVMQFVNNFTTAVNPQITKSYASGDYSYMFSLIFKGAKYSYFLLMFFAIPLIFEMRFVLHMWLGIVPNHAVEFARLALLASLIMVLSNTMITAMLATGDIKKYQIIVGGLGMLVFPLAWLFFYFGLPPETAYLSTIMIFLCQLLCRLKLLKGMIGLSPIEYIKNVLVKTISVSLLAIIIPFLLIKTMDDGIIRLLLVGLSSVVVSVIAIWFIGINNAERLFFITSIKNFKSRIL